MVMVWVMVGRSTLVAAGMLQRPVLPMESPPGVVVLAVAVAIGKTPDYGHEFKEHKRLIRKECA